MKDWNYNAAGIMNALKNDKRVLGVVPKVTAQVFYNVGVLDINGSIDGIDAAEENRLFQFKDFVIEGNYLDLKNTPNSIILGKGVADKMLVQLGDVIKVTTSKGEQISLKVVGIYNILNMMIYEKMDSIAILKATGFSGKDVNTIFILIASTIGIVGGVFGLAFGLGLSYIIDNIPFNTASLPAIKTYPINYNPKIYLIGLSFSIVTTYFAGYFPARRASKIDPVIIIRGK